MARVRCVGCGTLAETQALDPVCGRCGSSVLLHRESTPRLKASDLVKSLRGVWRYRQLLTGVPTGGVVSLGEGGTPLLRAPRLEKHLGLRTLLLKDESRNPTGSFIDRGSTVLVSLAKGEGFEECACLTTGNLGASLAAYCAKAGITARVSVGPSTDQGKLYQMLAYGAKVGAVLGGEGQVARGRKSLAVTAGNPYLLEGEKTTCLEVLEELGWQPPDAIVLPVGTGGHLSMTWHALVAAEQSGLIKRHKTKLIGVGVRRSKGSDADANTELEESEPYLVKEAAMAVKATGGRELSTTDYEAVEAMRLLARTEGIFAEPASASVVSCLSSALEEGDIHRDDLVVGIVTGAGLKDTRAVSRMARSVRRVPVRGVGQTPRVQVGETKLEILRALSQSTGYGYSLWRELSETRRLSTASVYQHLSELEAMGLVSRAGTVERLGRVRVTYEATAKGHELVKMELHLRMGHEG